MSSEEPAREPAAAVPVVRRGQTPEFMQAMRERAAAKRAELKRIRDAEELQAKEAHAEKLAHAEAVLSKAKAPAKPKKAPAPPPPSESESEEEEAPPPPRASARKKGASYKELYYRAKLERLQAPPPPPPRAPSPTAYDVARHDIVRGVDRSIMEGLMRHYFPH